MDIRLAARPEPVDGWTHLLRVAHLRTDRDVQFWAALAAACVFWAVWGFFFPSQGEGPSPPAAPRFLLSTLIYPVLEEAVFRGALQGGLHRTSWGSSRFVGVSAANLVTSLAFSGAHVFYHPPFAALLVFCPSLIFGYFRDRYQGVIPAAVLHVFYNAGFFWFVS